METYNKWIVRTTDKKHWLRENKSKYGITLSLTDSVELAKAFDTQDIARRAVISYIEKKKSKKIRDLEIALIKVTEEDISIVSSLPSDDTLSIFGFGLNRYGIDTNTVNECLKKLYNTIPVSFDMKCDGDTIYVSHIIW